MILSKYQTASPEMIELVDRFSVQSPGGICTTVVSPYKTSCTGKYREW